MPDDLSAPPAPRSITDPPATPAPDSTGATIDSLDPTALALGIGTYVIWGFFPLYFHALAPAGPVEVIVHRAVWGLVFCLLVITFTRRLPSLWTALHDREVVWRLSLAGLLIVINWSVYVFAVQSGHTIDASLGYFINPLVTVALGMIVLHEKITPAQKVAVGLGALAVLVLLIGLGRLPWVSLTLALSFAFYALVKKKVSLRVGPLEGMAIETGAVTPFLLGYYAWLAIHGQTSFQALARGEATIAWPWHLILLIGAGALTMIPLIMFARAAQSLPLGVLGLIQYVAPVLQLIIGLLVFHEHMEPMRWVGTGIVWIALLVLSGDWILQSRRSKKLVQVSTTSPD